MAEEEEQKEEIKEEQPLPNPPQEGGLSESEPEQKVEPENVAPESLPLGEGPSEAREGGVSIEKNGNDVTITEIMKPKAAFDTQNKSFLASLLPKLKEKLNFRTEKRLSKILALAKEKGEIRNDDVEKLLHVSHVTASHYLTKLAQRGQLKNVGDPKWPKYKN